MFRRKQRKNEGQVLVEFALCVPLVVVLFGCALDLGLLMWKEQMLSRTARDGAIFAARICSNSTEWGQTWTDQKIDIEGYSHDVARVTDEDRTTSYIMGVSDGTGLQSSEVTIAVSSTDTAVNGCDSIEVTIDHQHEFLMPFTGFGNSFRIQRSWKAAFIANKVGTGPDAFF